MESVCLLWALFYRYDPTEDIARFNTQAECVEALDSIPMPPGVASSEVLLCMEDLYGC